MPWPESLAVALASLNEPLHHDENSTERRLAFRSVHFSGDELVTAKHRVLFLCTGNSARSQMAEGLVNAFLGERWEAFSAGTQPTGYVHPLAVEAMAEIGVGLAGQASKHVDVYRGEAFDVVITVCDDAAQNCPVWLGKGRRLHVGFPDPAAATGTHEERLEFFRKVRDGIRERLFPLLENFQQEKDAPSWHLERL